MHAQVRHPDHLRMQLLEAARDLRIVGAEVHHLLGPPIRSQEVALRKDQHIPDHHPVDLQVVPDRLRADRVENFRVQ